MGDGGFHMTENSVDAYAKTKVNYGDDLHAHRETHSRQPSALCCRSAVSCKNLYRFCMFGFGGFEICLRANE